MSATTPFTFSLDETLDVGLETGSPVSGDYGPMNNAFTGAVNWVKLEIDAAAPDDHHIDPAHRLQVALTRQ